MEHTRVLQKVSSHITVPSILTVAGFFPQAALVFQTSFPLYQEPQRRRGMPQLILSVQGRVMVDVGRLVSCLPDWPCILSVQETCPLAGCVQP